MLHHREFRESVPVRKLVASSILMCLGVIELNSLHVDCVRCRLREHLSRYDLVFFFSSRRRHTRYWRDWSSDVCSSDLNGATRSIEIQLTKSAYRQLRRKRKLVVQLRITSRDDGGVAPSRTVKFTLTPR